MSTVAIVAVLITTAATVYGLALLIFLPIRYVVRRYSAEREYQAMLRAHSIYRKSPKDRVL